MVKAVENYNI